MAEAKKKNKSKKNRKFGRNKIFCEGYKRRGQREKNKAVKLQKHVNSHPNDRTAFHALKNLNAG